MKILAIDPGPVESGVVNYDSDDKKIVAVWPKKENQEVIKNIKYPDYVLWNTQIMVYEKIESFGMVVGASVFETVFFSGRMAEAYGEPCCPVTRREVKLHLCNSMKAKDKNIRQAIIDRYEPTGGGKIPQIGTKAKPGPLFGMKGHAWSALALAITYAETKGEK